MNFRLLHADEIEKDKWNDVIVNADAPCYSLSWYLDLVADDWGGFINEEMTTIIPLCFRRKAGIQYIYQPFFTRNTGVYGGHADVNVLIHELKPSYRFMDFSIETPLHLSSPFRAAPRIYQVMNLSADYDSLHKNYSGNLKRSIRDANASGLKVEATTDAVNFTERFRKNTAHRIQEFGDEQYTLMRKLLMQCMKHAETDFLKVIYKGEEVASAFFCLTGNRIIYIEGYSSPEGRTLQAMHLLFDYYIKKQAGSGKLLDFGGSNVPGIAHFYRAFGATDRSYNHVYCNALPWPLRLLKKR